MNLDSNDISSPVPLSQEEWENVIPLGDRVLVIPEKAKDQTRSGIILPGTVQIPTGRGRVVKVSWFIKQQYKEHDVPDEHQIRELDKVIFHFQGFMPEDFEKMTEGRVLVPVSNILAKIVKDKRNGKS